MGPRHSAGSCRIVFNENTIQDGYWHIASCGTSEYIFAVGAHFIVGKIDLTLVIFLTAGSTIGAILGPRLLVKIQIDKSENKAKYAYAIIMVAIGILMILGRN